MRYTNPQWKAIRDIAHNLQIIACAGSGKTQVISARIVQILDKRRSDGILPANIVAFTFTDKAAGELKARISDLYKERFGTVRGLADMYVGTIHGFCLELLQRHLHRYLKYQVLNEVQARLLVARYSRQSGLADLQLGRYRRHALYLDVLNVVREAEVDERKLRRHPVLSALRKYEQLLDRHAYLDYSKMMTDAVDALAEDEDLRRAVAERAKYVVVDEYQDVNPLQERLVHLLHELGANICVVGDDDQTIYQWRGTNVRNILTFAERYPQVRQLAIEENFRSSKAVVDCARTVIENNDPDRLPKRMASSGRQPSRRGDVLCLSFGDPHEEARWIATRIRETAGTSFKDDPRAKARGLSWSDCAVLLRSVRKNAAPILAALDDAHVPYVVGGMNNLFDKPEVMAARSIFLFMAGHTDEKDVRRAWRGADLGISPAALRRGITHLKQAMAFDPGDRWSAYNLQRPYLRFLEIVGIRDGAIPGERGDVVLYNLGKFSQVISDFEQINFRSAPENKYPAFARFLLHEAPDYYPEGWQEVAYWRPDAVQVMTVHQAKGMEWPVVFVPSLQANRFPSKRHGGFSKWSVIPKEAVTDADRYDGGIRDERRLFYVALTRSQKYLYCSWAPLPDNQLYRRASSFLHEATVHEHTLTRPPRSASGKKLARRPRPHVADVSLSFSELKYFFQCPHQFKLRFLYGFNPELHEALGYGKSLHDCLAEVHREALRGNYLGPEDASELLEEHLHLPFATADIERGLRKSGKEALARYLRDNAQILDKIRHVEQPVELQLAEGVVVSGRIDLIRRTDTNETIVVDFKSTDRAQAEEVTREQLHTYALGYEQLTGTRADLIEVHNLDKGAVDREEVDEDMMIETANEIVRAGRALRDNKLERTPRSRQTCATCDLAGICREKPPARRRKKSRRRAR